MVGPRGQWPGPLSTSFVCTNLQFLGGRATEGGGWSGGWGLAPCRPRVSVPTSSFWVVGPGRQWPGPCQPPLSVPTSSFWVATRQKVGVGPEPGGWRRVNRVCLYQPPVSGLPRDRRWGLVQNLGVDTGGWRRVNRVCLYQPPVSGWQGQDGSGPGLVNLPCQYQPLVSGWPRHKRWRRPRRSLVPTSLLWPSSSQMRLLTTYQERSTRAVKVRCAPCAAPPRPCPAAGRPAPPHG